ncbi:MAG: alkaline phosphatase family protein [Halomonas sp.]|uniref:Alkaline phosphatase family protein n=1 Tax=Billgrantia tianxiuensis TaxID=2497861 RepID=A0A6I6SFN0_9GAMM|nr:MULTISPECIES: alkaline phosphatase family protein [Halomonas]MCE8032826.1 alkaline phosphatase family protein [Halomonas sp. MCCC 1A11057]MDX5434706.1 alkaline phosphatase family protein [Halomonas sp.]MDX5504124.1 alkaline phosphatase family protein [Halomonas sp.]QHC49289.1 alkaline phosphatase family protein [Halomonas tianxiuensis]
MSVTPPLPDVLAGPLLRRLTPERLVMWLVASRPLELALMLHPEGQPPRRLTLSDERLKRIAVGEHAWLHLIDVTLATPLPTGILIAYDLKVRDDTGERGIAEWAPHLLHEEASYPSFVLAERHHRLLHGSCRKPHHDGPDGLAHADTWLAERHRRPQEWPAWLLLTGDQVYADDVAGPMLVAIHALVARLGLFDEALSGATVPDSQALYRDAATYYRREALLPDTESNSALRERFFGGVRKPIFTTANAHNHLITFAEVIAMYLLAWSPVPWRLIETAPPPLDDEWQQRFQTEQAIIGRFVEGLPACARLLAHLPTLMIFDDHDVTDDWNLTADWEQVAYGHPFSRRIIGNALLAYLLCQGWGNDPDRLAELTAHSATLMEQAQQNAGWLPAEEQDALLQRLLRFQGWEYRIPGAPPLLVLDTRTRRWRSERHPTRPSGLMDWEALIELQEGMLDAPSAIIVSPAPMFGVKLIEAVQRLFALAGKPLLVDAENWMAHRGAASVMLNIFRHSRTPGNYVILSGDVHYSFAYDIELRHRQSGPRLWQITSSGIKNAFPVTLLDWFDRLNRWLYAPRSPLNWFTKRRRLAIHPRDPDLAKAGERLWNGCGLGLVDFDNEGCPSNIRHLDARGFEVGFPPARDAKSRSVCRRADDRLA